MKAYIKLFLIMPGFAADSLGQCFLTGADLSYTNEILSIGGIFKNENGDEVNPYQYFASRGAKIARLRLWHTPSNIIDHCGNPINTGGLKDVLNSASKVKSAGMQLKLSIHYSDYFTNPSTQKMPGAWEGLPHPQLLDSIANYTEFVLKSLHAQNTLPDIVCIGNETTWGFIDKAPTTNGFDWNEDGDKFNAALNAIDSFNRENNAKIKKALHFTESSAVWAAKTFLENGVKNFDVIGISYYPFFSPNTSLNQVGEIINTLYSLHQKEVMIFETGFSWTDDYADNYPNFISNNGDALIFPANEQGQLEYLMQLAETIEKNNGTGLIYWEPAFISSDMCDLWGKGSSYENAAMYNFDNRPLKSFSFFEYCGTSAGINKKFVNKAGVLTGPANPFLITVKNVPPSTKWKLMDVRGRRVMR